MKNLNMHGDNYICIAGKNDCSINFLKYTLLNYPKEKILVCPNNSDRGKDTWQPSLKKFAKLKKVKLIKLESLYKIKNLIFISIEFEKIINVKLFQSKKLYNFHFSILPKYRGCHTNFYQIYHGEKESGVTLHKIDNGIDTGDMISSIKFKIDFRHNAKQNYMKLMKKSFVLYKREFKKIINDKLTFNKQKLSRGSYYSKISVNYDTKKYIKRIYNNVKMYNKIRSLIFPPFQLPIYKNKQIEKVNFKNNKIILSFKK